MNTAITQTLAGHKLRVTAVQKAFKLFTSNPPASVSWGGGGGVVGGLGGGGGMRERKEGLYAELSSKTFVPFPAS